MNDSSVSLVRVRAAELAVGKPLRQPVYDAHGKLLLAAGRVVESPDQLSSLLRQGFVRDASWDMAQTRSRQSLLISASKKSESSPANASDNAELTADMDDVRWYVGETLYMQMVDNPSGRYTVRLIGFLKGRTVFVTAPVIDGKLEFVREGQNFVVRAFSGKKAYAFVATALKAIHAPHPYLQLSYPKDVRCTTVRRGARAQVSLTATVMSESAGSATQQATLTDLSVGGASAMLAHPVGEKGSQGCISFMLNVTGQDESLTLRMVVRSVVAADSGGGYKHGLEFLDVADHHRLILSAFVHRVLAEGE